MTKTARSAAPNGLALDLSPNVFVGKCGVDNFHFIDAAKSS
jgi:hypothetical protein